jgi:hypothetical protein
MMGGDIESTGKVMQRAEHAGSGRRLASLWLRFDEEDGSFAVTFPRRFALSSSNRMLTRQRALSCVDIIKVEIYFQN